MKIKAPFCTWQRIVLFTRWCFGPWTHVPDSDLWSLIPPHRALSIPVHGAMGFHCRKYRCYMIFFRSGMDLHCRLLIRDGKVLNSSLVVKTGISFRHKFNTYSFIKSRLMWEAQERDSNWPAKQVI